VISCTHYHNHYEASP
jgi:hypothetical protein